MQRKEKWIKGILTGLAELFAVYTVILQLGKGQPQRLLMAIGTALLVLLPAVIERVFHCRICLPFYAFALFYALGPMLGHCWYLYYETIWWDKLLHTAGGVAFAALGAFLYNCLQKEQRSFVASAVFALCFSVTVSVLWEFLEFGADYFLGMDMQNDTVLTGFTSYFLGDAVGMTGTVQNIQTVTVNGAVLPVAGYLDVGLFDTMLDMLVETLGALMTAVLLWLDKGRHPLLAAEKT